MEDPKCEGEQLQLQREKAWVQSMYANTRVKPVTQNNQDSGHLNDPMQETVTCRVFCQHFEQISLSWEEMVSFSLKCELNEVWIAPLCWCQQDRYWQLGETELSSNNFIIITLETPGTTHAWGICPETVIIKRQLGHSWIFQGTPEIWKCLSKSWSNTYKQVNIFQKY